MKTQAPLIYGLSLSPTRANFQKIPVTLRLGQRAGLKASRLLLIPILVPVHDSGREMVDVCARADQEQQHQKEGLKVEEGGLRAVVSNNAQGNHFPRRDAPCL